MAEHVSYFPSLISIREDSEELITQLKNFNKKNENGYIFGTDDTKVRCDFSEFLLNKINILSKKDTNTSSEVIEECLNAMVIMSRDHKSMTAKLVTDECLKNFANIAELLGKKGDTSENMNCGNIKAVISACKCLCNVIFITRDSRHFCCNDEFIQSLMVRLKKNSVKPESMDHELEFLTLRLIFLASVLNDKAKTKILENYDGRRILINFLFYKLENCLISDNQSFLVRCCLSSDDVKSCCETLKTLFNLNLKAHRDESHIFEEMIVEEFHDITMICNKCLLLEAKDNPAMTDKLHSDAGNCLYTVPTSCFSEDRFIPLVSKKSSDLNSFTYNGIDLPKNEGRDVSAITVILKSVEWKIKHDMLATEQLQPVLSLLSQLSRSSRCIRKYCKKYIIPPRKDFENRPEVGAEFHNKLIKLFTNANTEVKSAAADFVFVMCKEKVDRLVKYTGYGNAAGLLASRGLLAGGRGDTVYSDTDSDSDTEEYLENANRINPVTGHIPLDIPNPMEGMSDEQKEYLAVQLANQLSKLSSDDVIKPVCVDPNTGNLVSFQQKVHETVLPDEKGSDADSD